MRTIVHIGQHKTGSTALQSVLVADRERLARHGILYPTTGHVRRRHRLEPNHNGLFLRLNDRSVPGFDETLTDIGRRLDAQIAKHRPEVVLLSGERAFRTPDQLGAVALGRLDTMIPGPKQTVAYLRRPDRFLSSYHRQLIRQGAASIEALHHPARLDELTATSLLDYLRTVRLYRDHLGPVDLHDYDRAGDTIAHFYRTVLDLEPPAIEPARTNPSLPQVLTDLTLDHLHRGGSLNGLQRRSLIAFGEREPVDLLGTENRRRLLEWFTPQDLELGRHAGRDRFFADLDAMVDVPDDWLDVDQANRRYREVFEALVSPVDVHVLRRDLLLLESSGDHEGAARIFDVLGRHLSPADLEWYREDLEAATKAAWTIRGTRYARADAPDTDPEQAADEKADTVFARLRRTAASARSHAEARLGRR